MIILFLQLFAVQLLSFLALQYPIPKCLSVAKHAVNRLTSLCAALPARTRRRFFLPVLPCLVRFSNAFPPLRQDATELLIILGNLAYTQLNKDTSASLRKFYLQYFAVKYFYCISSCQRYSQLPCYILTLIAIILYAAYFLCKGFRRKDRTMTSHQITCCRCYNGSGPVTTEFSAVFNYISHSI